jgi:predicted peptidase
LRGVEIYVIAMPMLMAVIYMNREFPDFFSGMLNMQGLENGQCDATINVNGYTVTVIPLTATCRERNKKRTENVT